MDKPSEEYDIEGIMKDIKEFFEYNKDMSNEEFIKIIDSNKVKGYVK